ncbi:MAG TPA: hypothetical protein VLH81_04785, partial [Desulfobacterales bacterium]|nr:hypothetical protein [Desulfobacterales bacterium]
MSTTSSLGRSILRWVIIFFLAQSALLAGAWAVWAVPWAEIALPLAASAAYHALLAAALMWRRGDFRVEGTDEPLTRVNAPNVITLGRLSSIPTILALVLLARAYPVLPVALPFLCI